MEQEMIEVFNRPRFVLPTDLFVAGVNSTPLPSYEEVKPYFDRLTSNGVWGKAGPSAWIVVRGARSSFFNLRDLDLLRTYSVFGGFNSTLLRRLLAVRTEWSRK